ncbi:dynein light chain Tctex-type 5-like [Saccostrea echinata]|uniref:dynein light chain Tctex-type 5-like n=1 Tax=Saccostrea echinata TaxID=191078 RepID=UPI002A80F4A1|nr:dynein light chain Tctex-type 5-like [Saccostrea echinata]
MKDLSMSLTKSRIKTPRPKTGRTRRIKNEQEDSATPIMKEKGDHRSAKDRKDHHKDKHPHPEDHHKTPHHGDGHGKGANTSPAHASHTGRQRSFSFRDTSHSISSVKGHTKHPSKEHDRHSIATSGDQLPQIDVKYENTYKMMPDAKFRESSIRKIISDVLEENIKSIKAYDSTTLGGKCKLACDVIKERVKHLNITRYKIIASVIAAQKGSQSMIVTSRCLWDHKNDNYVSVKMELGEFFVLGTVYVVYAE